MNTTFERSIELPVKTLINELREAEFYRRYDDSIRLFAPLWNINAKPDFSGYQPDVRAELYELAGSFLISYGKAKNIRHMQDAAKDSLMKAIDYFWQLEEPEKVLACKMLMAVGYYQEGSISEYEALLEEAESYFTSNKTHPVYLQIQVNYLIIEISRHQINQAQQRMKILEELIETSDDFKVKILFYTQAGIIFRRRQNYEQSLTRFQAALEYALEIENFHYQALITNCIANTYRSAGRYNAALMTINEALQLAAGDEGWMANFLDTKANIYFDLKDYETAYDCAHEAVTIFRKGDDFAGLTEALWTEMRVLFKLDLRELAFNAFFELQQLALRQIGEEAAARYQQDFLEMVYVGEQEGDFFTKVNAYKRFLIQNALEKTGGRIVEASRLLGFPRHQTLSAMLTNAFPEVLDDLQIKRKPRSDRRTRKSK